MPTRHLHKDGDWAAGHRSLQDPKKELELETVFQATGLAEATTVREQGQRVRLRTRLSLFSLQEKEAAERLRGGSQGYRRGL